MQATDGTRNSPESTRDAGARSHVDEHSRTAVSNRGWKRLCVSPVKLNLQCAKWHRCALEKVT